MINILALIPNRVDATSLYRGLGPLSDIRRQLDIHVNFAAAVDESILDMMDLVFMQRPSTPDDLKIAQMCVDNGTPLWMDFDDLLTQVPEDNPAHDAYMEPSAIDRTNRLIGMANVVTVSTRQLKECLQNPEAPLNKNVFVVPNALPDKFMPLARSFTRGREHINWRGTNTHQRDLGEHTEPILKVLDSRPKLTMTFVGWNPWFITSYVPVNQALIVPAMTIRQYFKFMSATNPPIQIVPLHDSLFNRCKSNIAWLESCLTGAVCIGPAWEEWVDRPGILTYKTREDFLACMEHALDNPDLMEKYQIEGYKYIRAKCLMSQVNASHRIPIIKALIGQGDYPAGGATVTLKAVR
jgi:hypothetical protein